MKTKITARRGRTRKTTASSSAAARPPPAMAPAAARFRCLAGEGIRVREAVEPMTRGARVGRGWNARWRKQKAKSSLRRRLDSTLLALQVIGIDA